MAPPSTWLALLGRLGLFVVVFAAAASLVVLPIATVLSDWVDANPGKARIYSDISGVVAILAATWVMTRFADRRPFRTIGFATKDIGRDLLLGIATGIAWLSASIAILWGFGWASPVAPTDLTLMPLLGALLAGFCNVVTQQLIVCGYILQTIRSKAGFPVAVLISALLFSGLHAAAFQSEWLPPVNVLLAGLVFCLAYGISGNLWLGIGIHFAWNMLLGPVLGLTVSGSQALGLGWQAFRVEGPAIASGGAFGIEGGLVVTLTTSTLVATMLLLMYRLDIWRRSSTTSGL